VFIAVPFDEWLLRFGLAAALAIRLYEQEVLSLGQASKVAGLAEEEFVEKLAAAGVAVARYSPDELDQEMAVLQVQQKRRPYRVRTPKR
jgi:predicted HTH domain antitoxin